MLSDEIEELLRRVEETKGNNGRLAELLSAAIADYNEERTAHAATKAELAEMRATAVLLADETDAAIESDIEVDQELITERTAHATTRAELEEQRQLVAVAILAEG